MSTILRARTGYDHRPCTKINFPVVIYTKLTAWISSKKRFIRIMRRSPLRSQRPRKIVRGPRCPNYPLAALIWPSAQTIFLSARPQSPYLQTPYTHYPDEAYLYSFERNWHSQPSPSLYPAAPGSSLRLPPVGISKKMGGSLISIVLYRNGDGC